MNEMTNRTLSALILLMALSGCSSGPSESDIRAALVKQTEGLGAVTGINYKDAFAKIKLVGCAKAELGSYKCDIAGERGVVSGRFVKSDGVWVAVNER